MQIHVETALFLTRNYLSNALAPNKQILESLCTTCSAVLFSSIIARQLGALALFRQCNMKIGSHLQRKFTTYKIVGAELSLILVQDTTHKVTP